MSEKKSFWSTVPGLVTGLTGLLTAVVGLVTVLMQLDVIGGDSSSPAPAPAGVTTTVAGGLTATTVSGQLKAEPASLKLAATEREKALVVRNNTSALVTVLKPETTGRDQAAFRVDDGCTNVALRPGLSCTVKVQLNPSGPLKTYEAALVLGAREIAQATEVPLQASTLL